MKGYAGKLLRVNLTTKEIKEEAVEEIVAREYLGGRGLGAKILYEELDKGIDPLGPENKFLLLTGPLANTHIPGSTRFLIVTKSPLTGGWGDANAAGRLGPMIKRAGYDGIIVEGRADQPVYIWVRPGKVEIRDASHLWGKTTGETREKIRKETISDAEVAAIGIAGENLVRYACVISEYNRAAGRSGTGAVMGSKNLKAIAVYGNQKTQIADEGRFNRLRKEMNKMILSSVFCESIKENGTAGAIAPHNFLGMYPAYNFREGVSDEIDKITGETMTKTILIRRDTCPACPVRCRRVVKVEGKYANEVKYGGPEFETIGSLGACCGIYNLEVIVKAHELCNKYGVDTINTGLSICWAMECYEKGILSKQDLDDLDLKWGNSEAVLSLLEKIAKQEGIGKLLAQGLKVASEKVGQGSERFAMQVKNQAFPLHMPRGKIGQGLSFATSNRGACHVQGMHDTTMESSNIMPDIGFDESLAGISRLAKRKKPFIEMLAQNLRAAQDSLIICRFVSWDYGPTPPTHLVEILNAVTGWDMTVDEWMKLGERVFNLCRMFNVREGMSRKDDTLPARVSESLPRGLTKGSVITKEDLNRMLDEYYELRSWTKDGIPTEAKLKDLGLELQGDTICNI